MKIQRRRSSCIRNWLIGAIIILITISTYWVYLNYSAPGTPIPVVSHQQAQSPVKKLPPSASTTLDHNNKANHPQQLIIKKLAINADVLPMGILDDGAMEAPESSWDVGWYNQSALPGSGEGALLIDGHVNDELYSPGVFYKINTLQKGDEIIVVRGDNKRFTYRVMETDEQLIEDVDMAKMMRSITPEEEGLNLITCGGTWDNDRRTYDKRILVYAERTL